MPVGKLDLTNQLPDHHIALVRSHHGNILVVNCKLNVDDYMSGSERIRHFFSTDSYLGVHDICHHHCINI